jgi:hypothetical protein
MKTNVAPLSSVRFRSVFIPIFILDHGSEPTGYVAGDFHL